MSNLSVVRPMATPLTARRTRAYFAPVDRVSGAPTIFDPTSSSSWDDDMPPAPWVSLGHIEGFVRTAESKIADVSTGMPAVVRVQAKQTLGATISFSFSTWNKLSMALSSGSDHMNVLAATTSSAPVASGGKALPAASLDAKSGASLLYLAAMPSSAFQVGDILVVDQDYVGQSGYVGAPYSAAYVSNPSSLGTDPDYIRRVSFNIARILSVGSDGGIRLASPLPAGTPVGGMKVQQIVSFLDREGGSFFQEWSGLFTFRGIQGDQLFLYYPRLQACQSAAEATRALADNLAVVQPAASFRAFPVTDGNDGQQILCYRSYFPNLLSSV